MEILSNLETSLRLLDVALQRLDDIKGRMKDIFGTEGALDVTVLNRNARDASEVNAILSKIKGLTFEQMKIRGVGELYVTEQTFF